MNEEETGISKTEFGGAGDANSEIADTAQTPVIKSVAPLLVAQTAHSSPSEIQPRVDCTVTNSEVGESGGGVIEPPKADLASPALPNINESKELEYSLTLKQVPLILQEANRHVPSMRSLTRYCQAGDNFFKCRKIKTSYGQEWLVNKESLDDYIDHQPILIEPIEPPEKLDINTSPIGAASNASEADIRLPSPDAAQERGISTGPDTPVMADSKLVGEGRTLAEVLIENARLTERSEASGELVAELKEDKEFLREAVREDRKHRGEVKDIAHKMLETMTTMATVQRLSREEVDEIVGGGKPGSSKPDVL